MINYKYIQTSGPQWNHSVGMENEVVEMKCWNKAAFRNEYTKHWLIDKNLSVDHSILRIAEFYLKLLDCSKKPTIWTWVAKTTSTCKIPLLQVGWRLDSIFIGQSSLS